MDVTLFVTDTVYPVVPLAKVGLSVPLEIAKPFKSALLDWARVTEIVYVLVVPSCAVTKVVIVFAPTFKAKLPLATPLVTVL